MNAKRVLKELGRVAECNPFQVFRPQLLLVVAFFAFGIIAAESSDSLLPADHPTLDHAKPVNWPTFETHRDEGRAVCGGPVVPASEKTPSEDTVVVGLDGRTVLMDTTEVWDRAETKNEYDNVWVIGVCKSHIQH